MRTIRAAGHLALASGVLLGSVVLGAGSASAAYSGPPIVNAHQAELAAPVPGANDWHGNAVAVDGDTMVVGSMLDDTAAGIDAGSASVYVRDGATWTHQQTLVPSIAGANDHFGESVDISGGTIIVGAPLSDHPAGDSGMAFIFARSGSTWAQQAALQDPSAVPGAFYGQAVAVSGTTAFVGAPQSAGHPFTPLGFPYERSGSTWTARPVVNLALGVAPQMTLALDGDVLAAGLPTKDIVGVFNRGSGTWLPQGVLQGPGIAAGDAFGASLDVRGETIVVGAMFDDTHFGPDAGSVYAYARTAPTTWSLQSQLFPSTGSSGDWFGHSVALSDDLLVVGASHGNTAAGAGAVTTFNRTSGGWVRRTTLTAPDGSAGDRFGNAVGASGDTVVVGAMFDDSPANSGVVHVFVPAGFVVGSVSTPEGNAGSKVVNVPVTLAAPYPVRTLVEVRTESWSATAGTDFTPLVKTLSFSPGQVSKTVAITVLGDTVQEGNESFGLVVANSEGAPIDTGAGTVTITDDDAAPAVTISVADTAVEGNTGTTNMKFNVTLSGPSTGTVTARFTTANGSAVAPGDYTAKTNIALAFPAGTTTKQFTVPVVGDVVDEPNETFTLTLVSVDGGVTIADGTATGTITDND